MNALVGEPVLTPSCIAHTTHPTVVGYAAKPSLTAEAASRKRTPVAWDRNWTTVRAMTSAGCMSEHRCNA